MYYSVPDKIINSLQRVAAFEGNRVTEIKEKITGICLKHIKNENLQNGMMHLQIEQLHTASSSRSLQRVERSAVLSQTHRKNREQNYHGKTTSQFIYKEKGLARLSACKSRCWHFLHWLE